MSVRDAFREYAKDILPRGSWWRGPAADRFLDGLADAFEPTIELLQAIPDVAWPWEAERPVLEQWHDFLAKVECVATPAVLEDLRTRVLDLLRADPTVYADGLSATILAYLPMVEMSDLLPLSILGHEIAGQPAVLTLPFPIDPAWATVEIWYPSTVTTADQVRCVARPFVPGVAIARPVTPTAVYSNPTASTLAGDIALHWSQMRSATQLSAQRRNVIGDALLESVLIDPVDQDDHALISDLFSLIGPGADLSGQYVIAAFRRLWDGLDTVLVTVTYVV